MSAMLRIGILIAIVTLIHGSISRGMSALLLLFQPVEAFSTWVADRVRPSRDTWLNEDFV
jgi:hypothetical protein